MSTERHREKRERILAAARELFLRQGLRATTMEAIARGAGMAKPTLYAEFADKDAVFLAILEQLVADKQARFDTAMSGSEPLAERIGWRWRPNSASSPPPLPRRRMSMSCSRPTGRHRHCLRHRTAKCAIASKPNWRRRA